MVRKGKKNMKMIFSILLLNLAWTPAWADESLGSSQPDGSIPMKTSGGSYGTWNVGSSEWNTEMNNRKLMMMYNFNSIDSTSNTNFYIIPDISPITGGNKVNLAIDKSRYTQGTHFKVENGNIDFLLGTLVTSDKPTNHLEDQCGQTNEFSVELWIENKFDLNKTRETKIVPVKIMSLATSIDGASSTKTANFMVGQSYEAGTLYRASFVTPSTKKTGGDGVLPNGAQLVSDVNTPELEKLQHVVVTRKGNGDTILYVSYTNDEGQAVNTVRKVYSGEANFKGSIADSWYKGSYLALGDELTNSQNTIVNIDQTNMYLNRRSWLGKIHLAAVYCSALPERIVLGERAPSEIQYQAQTVDPNFQPTDAHLKAALLYKRLTSVSLPITNPIIDKMAGFIAQGNPMAAAALAVEEDGFYNITVKDFAMRMSNRDETVDADLNDFVATIIGATRDEIDSRTLLYGNFYYRGDETKAAVRSNTLIDIVKSNNHYVDLENGGYKLKDVLVRVEPQMLYNGGTSDNEKENLSANPDPAGLLTTRAFMGAHGIAGTNRRIVEYTFRQFLCIPIEQWSDGHGPDNFIGRDIDRFPAGDHEKFTTTCRSCHSMMDPLRPAFSRFTFANDFIKNAKLMTPNPSKDPAVLVADDDPRYMSQMPAGVSYKMNHNFSVYPNGFEIKNDENADAFQNLATNSSNSSYFGWVGELSGNGPSEFGKMVSRSKAFPSCMAKRVYRSICKREPTLVEEAALQQVADDFKSSSVNFNLKELFKLIATHPACLGN